MLALSLALPASAQHLIATDFAGTVNGRVNTEVRFVHGERPIGALNFVLTYDPQVFAEPVVRSQRATCTVDHAQGRITGVRPLNPGIAMGTELLCRIAWQLRGFEHIAPLGSETSMRLPEVGVFDPYGNPTNPIRVTEGYGFIVLPPPGSNFEIFPGIDTEAPEEPLTQIMLVPPPPSMQPRVASVDVVVQVRSLPPVEPANEQALLQYTPVIFGPGDAFVGDWGIRSPVRSFRLAQAPNLHFRGGDPPTTVVVRILCTMQAQEQRAVLHGDFWTAPGGRLWGTAMLRCPADPDGGFGDGFE